MFDITSSKLLLLAIVALLVIGPKDFPVLLRTIGKYMGIIRGHAREFRAQFDEAMRESELAQMKKDVENFARETEESLNATKASVEKSVDDARQGVEGSLGTDPFAPADLNAAPAPAPTEPAPAQVTANGADGALPTPEASPTPEAVPAAGTERVPETVLVPAPASEKAGA